MRFEGSKEHVVDFAFAIALFFVFAACALTVVITSLQSYSAISKQAEGNYNGRTSMAYISQKIRHTDSKDAISISTIDDVSVLSLKQDFDGEKYTTYIYELNGELKELFVKDDTDIDLESGQTIVNVQSFSMVQNDKGLYQFTLTDITGKTHLMTITPRT